MASFEKTLSGLAIAALTVAAGRTAGATPNFPPRLATELELTAAPACALCHEGPTQKGTVITPFGTSMRGRGLVAYDEASLVTALMALEGEGTDSDGDGVGDIEELQQGADPNLVEGGEAPIVPEYGCSVGARGSSARGGDLNKSDIDGVSVALALAALARRISARRPR